MRPVRTIPINKIKNHVWYVKWLASLLVVLATFLTAYDFIPANKYASLIATLLWLYVSMRWNDRAMILMNVVILTILAGGIFN